MILVCCFLVARVCVRVCMGGGGELLRRSGCVFNMELFSMVNMAFYCGC